MSILKSDERIDKLIRENIDIIQSKSVFSFSLDAVLLAYFAQIPQTKQAVIVDACSGNGAVAFMLSAKTTNKVIGIEYQERLADMAWRTIQLNGLSGKVDIIHGDYTHAEQWLAYDSVDVVTCNPPYFAREHHQCIHEKETYALARHEITITLEEWVSTSAKLLKMGGKLYCVHRPERLVQILAVMQANRLMPKRLQFVHPKAQKEANIVLIEAIKDGKANGTRILPNIVVFDDQGKYTPFMQEVLYG
ncbi:MULTISPECIES: tRNA1(Val) (adenine(37)-N6)-methyltransferase [unclassified Granulicatella]|uniref:tRNA1(Val) (adenine(37)-N6)-methyltransferase n=1 Tax=unclassified Granulicatella TaxID=2630493 RepID=UPI001072FE5E|nr:MULTISPECIES: tRNA1(Val) (adenine(37)-N6)-methyltransferase [unclassified Granulicatella]MBF0780388.1 tRNA1(Val) (adenine(37)-N6)-methyltransferase [Granulicatella sp. 19428wC4_WM01]TFU95476.1 tRNA1(Val) (adenine(37)-N6)-methyltransferase [Granulicatella sp. WM01]